MSLHRSTTARALLVSLLALGPLGGAAQELPTDLPRAPAVLTADEVRADDQLGIVVASGHVEVQQADRLVRADRITYSRRTGTVAASGHVVLVDPTGNVAFADYAELQQDLAEGFVEKVSLLLADNSRVIANSGVRTADGRTVVDRAVYSPCALCPANPRRAPLWQIRAAQVTHDAQTKDVIYRDAFFDVFGIPIAYTPYFRHPDPTVRQRSGLLPPRFGSTADLGPFFNGFYYWGIAPDQDATFQVNLTRKAGVLFGTEYRRRFAHGEAVLDGSVNRSERQVDDDPVAPRRATTWRGHFFGSTRFDLGPHWRTGGTLQLVSDPTYLKVFDISEADVLESRGWLEGFYGPSYASAEVIGFDDLRTEGIDQPLVVPWLSYQHVSAPGVLWGGRWHAEGSLLDLVRTRDVVTRRLPTEGVDTRRLSASAGWDRTDYTKIGLVTTLAGSVRGDLYWSDDLPDPADPTRVRDQVVAGRLFPRAAAIARYPLVRPGTWQQLVEPVVGFTAAPRVENGPDIPNNDSLAPELDELNLFSEDAFPGLDRVDDGLRLTYGLNLGLFGPQGGSSTLFVGQSYRVDGSADETSSSGLEPGLSDIVGRMSITPSRLFNLDWRFRFDDEDLSPQRQEVSAAAGTDAFRVRATYAFIRDLDPAALDPDQNELYLQASSHFARYWTVTGALRRDIEADETRSYRIGVTYADECFTFGAELERRLTQDRDLEPGTSVYFRVGLRNLGELPFSVEPRDLLDY